jgi:hypothetical protein
MWQLPKKTAALKAIGFQYRVLSGKPIMAYLKPRYIHEVVTLFQ